MNQQRKLTIIDVAFDGETTEKTKMNTVCTYSGDLENCTVEFDEIFAEDMKSHTTMRIKDGKCVHLLRQGAINTEIIIEEGKRHSCAYNTPYGQFTVGVTASEVSCIKKKVNLYIVMKYNIDFYGDLNQTKQMTLIIENTEGERKEEE